MRLRSFLWHWLGIWVIGCVVAASCNKLLGDEPRGRAVDAPNVSLRCSAGMVFVDAAPPFCMDAYEASRSSGDLAASVGGAVPWASITYGDAKAACQRAGKRLCKAAEFAFACGGAEQRRYPYGNAYEIDSCHGKAAGRQAPALTGAFARCGAPQSQGHIVADLLGNVAEWAAECGQPSTVPFLCDDRDNCCVVFGDGFSSLDDRTTCALPTVDSSSTASIYAEAYRGFRCCSEPIF